MTTAVASPPEDKPKCEYHIARNIYEKPRVCEKCGTEICHKRIPVEPREGWLTTYTCTLSVNHEGRHNNSRIKESWRLDNDV